MQTQVVSLHQLRNRLGEFLNRVYYQKQEIIVEKMKKPIAKIIALPKSESFLKKSSSSIAKYYGVFKIKKKYSIKEMEKTIKTAIVEHL